MVLLVSLALAADDYGPAPATAKVASVYDGDTFTLASGDKVRVGGVNTPELRPAEAYGIEAREATEAFVAGKEVSLTYGSVQRDSYGRLIAWVEVDGEPLADHLIERGLGHLFQIPPVETGDAETMLAAQARAREANRGIWSTDSYRSTLHMTSFHANAPGDDRENVNGEYMRVCNITTEPLNIDGYRITDASGASWTFPDMVVPPGHTFKVHSGIGEDQKDPSSQLAIYLGSPTPVWNNDTDRATIYDRYDNVVDSRLHSVKNPSK